MEDERRTGAGVLGARRRKVMAASAPTSQSTEPHPKRTGPPVEVAASQSDRRESQTAETTPKGLP